MSDTADFVPVGPPDELVDAPGNIGDGRIYGLRVTARAPLKMLRGATLTFDGTRQESRVTDPLTGETRGISEFQDWQLAAGFRQDLPRLAWGFNYTQKSVSSSYLLEEIDRARASPSLDGFFELALARGMRLRFSVVSLLGQPEMRDRLFYAAGSPRRVRPRGDWRARSGDLVPDEHLGELLTRIGAALPCRAALP